MFFELPQYNIIEKGAKSKLSEILFCLNIKKSLTITDENLATHCTWGDIFFTKEIKFNSLSKFKAYDGIIGFGGGVVIDKARYLSHHLKIPFISFTSSLSTDAISSSIGTFDNKSIFIKNPAAVIIDLEIINNSPKRLSIAGYGELMAKITANLDWELANKENNDFFDKDVSILVSGSVYNMLNFILENKFDLETFNYQLSKALFLCGLSTSLTKSSRPISGAEHNLEKALLKNKKIKITALHGEIVGVSTLFFIHLYELKNKKIKGITAKIRASYKKIGHPTSFKELGFEFEEVLEALFIAHNVRSRYTILRDGIDRVLAKKVLNLFFDITL